MSLEFFIILILSVNLAHIAWKNLHSNPLLLDYMRCDPNAWRWWEQLLLILHKRPLSFQTLEAITWIVIINILYIMLVPTGLDLFMFLLSIVAVSLSGYIRQAPIYPLLLLTANISPLFLVPLTLVKEIGGWLGVGVLLLQGRSLEAAVFGGLAFLCYAVLRIGSKREYLRLANAAPLFTPPYYLTALRKKPLLILKDLTVTLLIIGLYFWAAPLLFIWAAIPILLFAQPWESQLWFPLFVIVLGVF